VGQRIVTRLAILDGDPAFPQGVPFVRPPTPPLERVVARLAPSYEQGVLTNGPLVAELERRAAERLGVTQVVAVASCTAGLMLTLRGLAPTGAVLVPSFTFSAGPHAVAWNGLAVAFAECDPASFQLDCADAAGRLEGVGAVMATHVAGAPAAAEAIEELAADAGVPALFDAAHAFGARRGNRAIGGFGAAEVFSLTPTKPLIAGEGGLVATDRDELAELVRVGRDYGNPGDYDARFVGLNARMSELHAAVALESLVELDDHLATRKRLARHYLAGLEPVPGISAQQVATGDASTWKDFTVRVRPEELGVSRDVVVAVLRAEGVDTRCYFDPPVHRQRAHAGPRPVDLPVTDAVSAGVVSLPLYRDLDPTAIDRISELLAQVHAHAAELASSERSA
jgi:dTDP-4-amino-4,6-dideoxygalactose transaminase